MQSLKNKKVVVVGGSSGIGSQVAVRCALIDATVFIIGRSLERLQNAAAKMTGEVVPLAANMLDEEAVEESFKKVGSFDHLVVTAVADETKLRSPLNSMTLETAQRGMEKFWITFLAARAASKRISSDGSMTLTSSVSIYRPSKQGGLSVMSATSGAVASFSRQLAAELAPVRVNCIVPGVVSTQVWGEDEIENLQKWATESLPVKHLGQPEELADAVMFLITNTYTTGSLLTVDGGLSIT